MPQRRCGASRIAGGIYLATKTGIGGVSPASFLVDPPLPLAWTEIENLGLSPIGVHPHRVKHPGGKESFTIFDWIGQEHYPFWPDFYEEVRRHGLSRHLALSTGTLKTFTKDGTYVLIHSRGHLLEQADYIAHHLPPVTCPTRQHKPEMWSTLAEGNRHCQAMLWEAIDDEADAALKTTAGHRAILRPGADFEYSAWKSPDGVLPEFAPAIVMRIPLEFCRLEVVNASTSPASVDTALRLAQVSELDTVIVSE